MAPLEIHPALVLVRVDTDVESDTSSGIDNVKPMSEIQLRLLNIYEDCMIVASA